MAIKYEHPPVDNVAAEYHVEVPEESGFVVEEIETVEDAIEIYLQAFYQKFSSKMGRAQRRICLQSFQQYLVAQGHPMKLQDLKLSDGQHYLDILRNRYNGLPLKPSQIKGTAVPSAASADSCIKWDS